TGDSVVVQVRLRRARLSFHSVSARLFLAGRMAALESAEQLRCAVSRAMGHHGIVSVQFDLSASAAAILAQPVLPGASVSWRHGNVCVELSMDATPLLRGVCWNSVCL